MNLGLQCQSANITVLHAEDESSACLLDQATGRIHSAELSPAYLLKILRSDTSSRWAQNLEDEEECIGEDIGRKVADRLLCVYTCSVFLK